MSVAWLTVFHAAVHLVFATRAATQLITAQVSKVTVFCYMTDSQGKVASALRGGLQSAPKSLGGGIGYKSVSHSFLPDNR